MSDGDGCGYCYFNLDDGTTSINMPIPSIGAGDSSINNDVDVFDFWDDDFDTINKGINSQPLSLSGVIGICGEDDTEAKLCTKIEQIWTFQNEGAELTITGLESCMNAVYIIKSFNIGTMPKYINLFRWSMALEKVRD